MTINVLDIDAFVSEVTSKNLSREDIIRLFETFSDVEKEAILDRIRDNLRVDGPQSTDGAQAEGKEPLVFQEGWREVAKVAATGLAEATTGRWIVLREEQEALRLMGLSQECLHVVPGERVGQLSQNLHTCPVDYPDALNGLLSRLIGRSGQPVSLVYTWSRGKGEAGFYRLFSLFKALLPLAHRISRVILIGDDGKDSVESCWEEAWIGFQRSVKLHFAATAIGIVYSSDDHLDFAALTALADRYGVIRVRGTQISSLSLQSARPARHQEPLALKQKGAYLVTGGAGGLGLVFARYLARHFQARLVLLGRRPQSDAIRAEIKALRDLGATDVRYEAVDVCDEPALAALASRLPFSLSGILHAAGVQSSTPFFERTVEDIRAVMDCKTRGTQLLDKVFGQQPLDFVCYFSSSAALLGDLGSCDYAAANRFLMRYGALRAATGQANGKSLVINWPLWSEEEGGMAGRDAQQTAFYLKSSGQVALCGRDALPLWCDLLHSDLSQALVMAGDKTRIEAMLQRIYAAGDDIKEDGSPSPATVPQHNAQPQETIEAQVRADLRSLIVEGYHIPPERLEDDVHLAEYGLDSLNLTRLAQTLSAHFSVPFTPALFFSHITVAQLTAYLVDKHGSHLVALYRPATPAPASLDAAVNHVSLAQTEPVPAEEAVPADDPVAIIGMSGRFPEADTVDEFWSILSKGRDVITDIPRSRWNWRDYYVAPGHADNRITTNKGGFLRDIERFDALFFDVSPREAQLMDPAQRLLLMEAYRAIENAGFSPQALRGSNTAVFVGMEESQYELMHGWGGISTGGASMIASRLSYFLDFHGPCIATNTACSSGLVAFHQAVTALRQGECDMALVAGVSLSLSPESYVTMSAAGMLSPSGQCRSFGAAADGIGIGEAVVVLVLTRLSAALAENAPVQGLVRASGVNFDGRTNGVTAPNGRAQQRLIERLYGENGIDIDAIGHIVTHGTGTRLGDPVEVIALTEAFNTLAKTPRSRGAALTSCKSNIGHTMAASGLVGLVSLLQGLRHEQIPPSLHCETENPDLGLAGSGFHINKVLKSWPRQPGEQRLGAVSSFGRSGTNAHVVIGDYAVSQTLAQPVSSHQNVAILVSATTQDRLRQKLRDLLRFVEALQDGHPEAGTITLTDIAYTLQVGRDAKSCRLGFVVDSMEALRDRLEARLEDGSALDAIADDPKKPLRKFAKPISEEQRQRLDTLLAGRDLPGLVRLWEEGVDVDWQKLYGEDKPRRIGLPGYPFTGDVYRLRSAETMRISSTVDSQSLSKEQAGKVPAAAPLVQPALPAQPPLVIIGGAGLFGICMGVFLKRANIPFRIIEKNEDVGGVWFVNRWPGCGCDIPMLAYAYSFAHFKGDMWAKQPEILSYLQEVARTHDLYPHISFKTRIEAAEWQEGAGEWRLTLDNGETASARYFIHAANEGLGHRPHMPKLPGLERFKGTLMHTLECRAEDWDFTGRKIAIIGNGTTQIQLVEALQPLVEKLVVYARSPKYIYPRASYGRQTQERLSRDYDFWLKHRREYLTGADDFYHVSNDPVALNPFHPDSQIRKYFSRDLDDEWLHFYDWLRERDLVPAYSPGCSRPCMSHTYHRQIRAGNVALRTSPVTGITENGVETAEGHEDFDMILFATGYDLNDFKPRFAIHGRDHRDLAEEFAEFPKNYGGHFVSGFPNLLIASGANSGSNATSITAIYEESAALFVEIIRNCEERQIKAIEIKAEAVERFRAFVSERNRTGSFSSGCSAWFQTSRGENAAIFPGTFAELNEWRRFDPNLFLMEERDGTAEPPSPSETQIHRTASVTAVAQLEAQQASPEIGRMNDLAAEIMLAHLLAMQLLAPDGPRLQAWMEGHRPVTFLDRWLNGSLDDLSARGWLDAARRCLKSPRTLAELWQAWETHRKRLKDTPSLAAQMALMEACLKALPDILSGRRLATDVIFPNASLTLVEGIYRGNPIADYYNGVLVESLATLLDEHVREKLGQPLHLLEIGAGTGGTTAKLLPLLQAHAGAIADYCYTDLSKAFLKHAVQHYKPAFDKLTTALLDISRPLEGQAVLAGRFEIAIATNVLHATPDIRATLRHAKTALCEGGILLLNELSNWSLFNHLTFGLLDGWWIYRDEDIRLPGTPALAPETWRQLLTQEGFETVAFPATAAHRFGQQIIVARLGHRQMDVTPSVSRAPAVTEQMLVDHVRGIVVEQLSFALEIEPSVINEEASFADYGIDSILGVEFIQSVNRLLPVRLETTHLFDHASVEKLSAHILSIAGEAVRNELSGALAAQAPQALDPAGSKAEARPPEAFDLMPPAEAKPEHIAEPQVATRQGAIAIIGMSGRFAQSETLEAFWDNLKNGRDLVSEVTRWDRRDCAGPDADPQTYCSQGSFIDTIDRFDAGFFRISPLEAMYMDPQQRLFLEECWTALEHAGYAGKGSDRLRCGVFAGCCRSDYADLFTDEPPPQAFWGNAGSVIPARISYYLNLQGPAISVDTACSSSLVSIHLACQSLWSGETEMALAGGVFLQFTPAYYQVSNRAGMLSPDGKCHAFDARANGFVPGEGVGVVVLKRLEDALNDGDSVHGVIIGSGTNQDGSTNGITAPSAQSQERLQRAVYDRFRIDPESIQLVEAHGTGTRLGDPVEFTALSQSFRHYTDKRQFCALGSVKSNIGHATMAAGVAGVLKLVLALKARQIPPTLHFEEANPAIDFSASPFYPARQLADWPVPEGKPRRAAISSFGLSGTNAHMVIEEEPVASGISPTAPAYLVVLSARSAEQLATQADNLLAFCKTSSGLPLNDLSHTLLVGRLHLTHRLGLIARSEAELVALLDQWLAHRDQPDGRIHAAILPEGKVREQVALKTYGNQCIDACRDTDDETAYLGHLASIADLYVQGYELNFRALFAPGSRRIPLPTYPFARERHWVEGSVTAGRATGATTLHPLLHWNMSDLSGVRFTSRFTGEEFFLKDHVIRGEKILPAVAYLEMVRAALQLVLPDDGAAVEMEVQNTVWLQPLVVAHAEDVSITLSPLPAGEPQRLFAFAVVSGAKDQPRLHCEGKVALQPQVSWPVPDLATFERDVSAGKTEADTLYAGFAEAGVDYGPAHRGLESISFGHEQCLARLALPASVEADRDAFVLHPSLLDSALQACIGLVADLSETGRQVSLPFALDALRVLGPCSRKMSAFIRSQPGQSGKIVKLDIDLLDQGGNPRAQLRGLAFRPLPPPTDTAPGSSEDGVILAVPVWVPHSGPTSADAPQLAGHHVILCGAFASKAADIERALPGSLCQKLDVSGAAHLADAYADAALGLFEHIRTILKSKPRGQVLVQLVLADEPEQAVLMGLSGLLKTAALENPLLIGQIILTEPDTGASHLAQQLAESRKTPSETLLWYRNGARQALVWQERQAPSSMIAFKDHGVYLITGGLGGLGLIFAKGILRQSGQARLILTGRSALTEAGSQAIQALSTRENAVEYRQVDLTDGVAVAELIRAVEKSHGRLNGILHCAGMVSDRMLLTKTAKDFRRVLAPKVAGSWHLDQASRHLDLDFLVFFSSQVSVIGSLGQADYAAANGFMDGFSAYRNQLAASGKRRGHTLSINWPLWQEGGMRLDEESQQRLREATGMRALNTQQGLSAFQQSLALAEPQVRVMEGDLHKMRGLLRDEASEISQKEEMPMHQQQANAQATEPADRDMLKDKIEDFLRRKLSQLLKLPVSRIDTRAPLEDYGIDSILSVNLTNELEKSFGKLSKTLLFEYQNLADLADYFLASHHETLITLFAPAAVPAAPAPVSRAVISQARPVASNPLSPVPAPVQDSTSLRGCPGLDEPIAIIGLSGRYPQSRDLGDYWKNLREGRDCITEIPPSRWNWRDYFTEDRSKTGHHFSKWGGFIEGVDEFDPFFFNMSPREAEYTDPQERLFLQHAWMAMEDAGYTRAGLQSADDPDQAGEVGVYVGVMYGEYQLFGAEASLRGQRMGFAGSLASIANRVSYVLNLRGPSMTLDTMCSSSLTAIHLACQDLKLGRTSLAIAGGVNVTIHPNKYLMLSAGQFISGDGRCQSFGEGGDGYIPGEGVGAVVLKRLSQAERDGDVIHGVIRASTLNHGGKTNGYTVPNPQAQAAAVRRALKEAGVDPRHISYVEAHGTGTKLGDPIEIAGLSKAFGEKTGDTGFCFIGSVKSNIGHAESAAGIAGLTKILLQMKHGQIVPSLHSAVLNPNIEFGRTPFVVNQELRPWDHPVVEGRSIPRLAGLSSFGAGGSNAHLIIEEYRQEDMQQPESIAEPPAAIVLSAKNPDRLRDRAESLLAFLNQNPEADLTRIAYTLQIGREPMVERLALLVSSRSELVEKLGAWLSGNDQIDDLWQGQARKSDDTITMFAGDADLRETIGRWIAQRKYPRLLDLWVRGLNPDWAALHGDERPRRISLPAYSFARDRYWIPASSGEAPVAEPAPAPLANPVAAAQMSTQSTRRIEPPVWDEMTYRPVWVDAPQRLSARQGAGWSRILLVQPDGTGLLASDLLAALERRAPGAQTVRLWLGAKTERQSEREWSFNADDPRGFTDILDQQPAPDCVIFLGTSKGLSSLAGGLSVDEAARHELRFLKLAKALQQQASAGKDVDCFIVTADTRQPDGKPVAPEGAGLAGLGYALAQGDRRLKVRSIDVARQDLAEVASRRTLINAILDEPASDRGSLTMIRGGRRYQQSFLKWQWPSGPLLTSGLRQGGVYLIAGGAGTVGQILTRHLMTRHGARVVWLGRSPGHDPALRAKLRAFEGLGTPPLYVEADVTQIASLEEALRRVKQTCPVLNGAIFSSLVFHPENSIAATSAQAFRDILAVKINGALNFQQALQREDLDFLCHFSSVQAFSFLSAKDSVGYASGITFADAIAQAGRAQSRFPIGTINWGYWAATIRNTPLEAALATRFGLIEDQPGMQFFDQFVSQLREGGADQLLFMPASEALRTMMGMRESEISTIAAGKNPSLFARLKEDYHDQASL
ncbi:SDR family NAD(P)-dependent oxidoreductase [Agrobacterium vitis]|uniref:SDR family NAD(P)-dependent oxidoreductase n=1 Tax=Agrobacterium vitis TaxID=373 RepID=UPI0012E84AC7|nr:SDR family NAD(P)-dependent oxidoreductase [Agrobacterium vitis]MVA81559.1 SDR family NAD(P)-dependent oxidoreductase [Agrobacterium vitis]